MDYEPPFFRGCTEDEAHNPWTRNPLKMEVGKVNSKHLILALKVCDYKIKIFLTTSSRPFELFFLCYKTKQVKSVLDPCEDENNDNQDDEVSLGADSHQKNDDDDSDSEVIA